MRLRRIEIKNFRAIREVTVLPAALTCFIGENATGKSCILQALQLLFDPDARRLQAGLCERDINVTAIAAGERVFTITVELGGIEQHPEIEAIFWESIDQDGTEKFVTIQGEFSPDDDNELVWKAFVLPPSGRKSDPTVFSSRMARAVPLFTLDAVLDARRETSPSRRGLLSKLLKDIDLGDVTQTLQDKIHDANLVLSSAMDVKTLTDDVSALLAPNLPGGAGSFELSVATEDLVTLVRSLGVALTMGSLGPFDMDRHATGVQNIALIAMFQHFSAGTTAVAPMLAIEEPEAHLHPQAQRGVLRTLVRGRGPTLITTHSPTVVEVLDPETVVRLRRAPADSRITVHQLISPTDAQRKDLALLLRAGRADALFARAIVLVEGPSEKTALPAFADALNIQLDRDGISVVSADGNAFGYVLRSLSTANFAIPVVVTFDTDALDKSKNPLLKAARDAGLLSTEAYTEATRKNPEAQTSLLQEFGWIPVKRNFEEVVCGSGYQNTILDVITKEDCETSLDNFLSNEGLAKGPDGISRFLATRNAKRLKTLVARAVAEAVPAIAAVPSAFETALNEAARLAAT